MFLHPRHRARTRYIMIGGFLGAGKTTAIGLLAQRMTNQGLRVGLITNDQGRNLVDTTILRTQGFATEEIPGGCFCCRFDSLVEAAANLARISRPDVFIAEPVGSCTDLIATVAYPLRRLHGSELEVAPVSVLVDPIRARRVFGLEPGGSFSDKVLYIYRKQIEEADLVVISKCDLVDGPRLEALRGSIAQQYPNKEILSVSARQGTNLEAWFSRIMGEKPAPGQAMEVDYAVYAEGEALLGWLNSTMQLQATQAFDPERFLQSLAADVQKRLQALGTEIAHLKMSLKRDTDGGGETAAISLVRSDFVPELSLKSEYPVQGGQLLVNLRAEAAPEVLGTVLREALAEVARAFPTLQASIDHLEQFRPGKPNPTHRMPVGI